MAQPKRPTAYPFSLPSSRFLIPRALLSLVLSLSLSSRPCHCQTTNSNIPFYSGDPNFLFIGNSYTGQNSLPNTFKTIVETALPEWTPTLEVKSHNPGGQTLGGHLNNANNPANGANTIRGSLVTNPLPWKWVTLQDQSQVPGLYEWDWEGTQFWQSLNGAQGLSNYTRDNTPDGQTMFYMTWGRRNGDRHNSDIYPDFLTMQGRLVEGYFRYLHATTTPERPTYMAPVGLVFETIHNDLVAEGIMPNASGTLFTQLYSGDGSHPSRMGTYVAALTIFTSMTGLDPLNMAWWPDNVDEPTARTLQDAIGRTVLETFESGFIPYAWTTSWTGSTAAPLSVPTSSPTSTAPTTLSPTTASPTNMPTTLQPTAMPTTVEPTFLPTLSPTSEQPSMAPTSEQPSMAPTTEQPSMAPTTDQPSMAPTTDQPSMAATTIQPSTVAPTGTPPTTPQPTAATLAPTSQTPTTLGPTSQTPTPQPTLDPTIGSTPPPSVAATTPAPSVDSTTASPSAGSTTASPSARATTPQPSIGSTTLVPSVGSTTSTPQPSAGSTTPQPSAGGATTTPQPSTLKPTSTNTINSNAIKGSLTIEIQYDAYPQDIAWTLLNLATNKAVYFQPYGNITIPYSNQSITFSNLDGNTSYAFKMSDQARDGICCLHGDGYVRIMDNNNFGRSTQLYSFDLNFGAYYEVYFDIGDFGQASLVSKAADYEPSTWPDLENQLWAPAVTDRAQWPGRVPNTTWSLVVNVELDHQPEQVSWEIHRATRNTTLLADGIDENDWIFVGGWNGTADMMAGALNSTEFSNLQRGWYRFRITDSGRNGLCCNGTNATNHGWVTLTGPLAKTQGFGLIWGNNGQFGAQDEILIRLDKVGYFSHVQWEKDPLARTWAPSSAPTGAPTLVSQIAKLVATPKPTHAGPVQVAEYVPSDPFVATKDPREFIGITGGFPASSSATLSSSAMQGLFVLGLAAFFFL